jgi:hypothetical protein
MPKSPPLPEEFRAIRDNPNLTADQMRPPLNRIERRRQRAGAPAILMPIERARRAQAEINRWRGYRGRETRG